MNYYCKETKFGFITISENSGFIEEIKWKEKTGGKLTPLIKKAFSQLEEYFDKKRFEFDIPLNPQGTEFQKCVWRELVKIPYGETRSYKDIATAIGNPKSCRAVGMANNKNPICIVIPCHRVIGSNGSLTGYAGGLGIKEKLLLLEHSNIYPL